MRTELASALAGLAEFERPKRVWLVQEPFSQEDGLLTPTLKLRRKEIAARFEGPIAALYEEGGADALEL
jgi:long-chain acyl-CoA synthetase